MRPSEQARKMSKNGSSVFDCVQCLASGFLLLAGDAQCRLFASHRPWF